jgi:hypothetical protein
MGNLGSAVDELAALDWDALPGPQALAEITELRRQINRLEGVYLAALERVDRTGVTRASHRTTAAFLRQEARLAGNAAHRDTHLARDLRDAFPATAAALRDGGISPTHAQLIATLKHLDADVLASLEPHLVDYARRSTPTELRKAVEHARHRFTPDDQRRSDDIDDYEQRSLHMTRGMHGNGLGQWQLHPVGQEMVATAIHALSKPIPGDTRTAAQRRADALVSMAELAMRTGLIPSTGGVKPHVSVIVPIETLARQSGAPAADYAHGSTSSAEWARRVACDASVARVVLSPVGEVLNSGRATRTFSSAQTRAIIVRDDHCIWPGCDAPAAWCDVHHCTHWADGGDTSVENGTLLCGRHHDRIHVYGHDIIRGPGRYSINLEPGSDPHWHGPPHRAGP